MRGRRASPFWAACFALGVALAPVAPASRMAPSLSILLGFSPLTAPLAFLLAGISAARFQATGNPPTPPEGEVPVEGRVESVPLRSEDRVRFLLRDAHGRLLDASAPQAPFPLALGDEVLLSARLEPPPEAQNPGGRDRSAQARARGVAWEARARAPPLRLAAPSPLAWLEAGRDRFAAAAAALPAREAALVRAVGTGDQSGVSASDQEAFARSGLVHLLSVSGLHLAVVAFGARRAIRWLLHRSDAVASRLDPGRASAMLAAPVAAAYALATGAQVPVVRSAIGALAVFAAALLQRELSALDALALAALCILAADPAALGDLSFQLSFASVSGLALLTGPLRRACPLPAPGPGAGRARRAGEWLLQAACASAAATLATAPLTAFHFRRLSLLAVPANLVGVPVGSALTVLAAAAAATAAASPALAAPLLLACRPLAWALLRLAEAFGAPSWSTVGLASPGGLGVALCYGLGLASLRLRGAWRWSCAALAAAALLAPGPLRALLAASRGGLEVTFLSVGQGDAAVVRLPDGSALLVDAGGDPRGRRDPGARDVLPFLRDAGVRRLAAAFLSHPHADHLLGLPAVAEGMPVDSFLGNGRRGGEAMAGAWARLPEPRALSRGDAWERAGVRVQVLGPPTAAEGFTENEASLVLWVRYGETAFLLLGDVEGAGEAALLAQGDLTSDVAKVAHHGSRTASSAPLVSAVRPRWAVMSLSRHNPFGFPHPEAVRRWEEAGAEVLRTDQGAVRFLSDGRTVRRVDPAGALDAWALWREQSGSRP
ncbi:MAG TPA: DNA internalization-related competence protein ComEC/Rec2 [Anaeromyxobacteraceae bacterium]|nr:DNA internalization-related competence protein ComEC/Rec2 [Anaeromyxobacteraceae bacterium]